MMGEEAPLAARTSSHISMPVLSATMPRPTHVIFLQGGGGVHRLASQEEGDEDDSSSNLAPQPLVRMREVEYLFIVCS